MGDNQGRPLMEVFNVMINNIDNEIFFGDLYGIISVTDAIASENLYFRERSEAEPVKAGGSATLTGPVGPCILASDDVTIDVYLKDRDSYLDLSKDDVISKGQITWRPHNSNNKITYDVLLSKEISGKSGMATIFYAVFKNAVQARVEVKLIDGDKENPADVYGVLAVTNGKPGFENYRNELFRRTSGNTASVKPQQLIPFARSLVAVPLDSELKVYAELIDHDKFPDISPDDMIAKGYATFPAQLSGTYEKIITGKYGSIQVKVTWTPAVFLVD